MNDAQIAVEAIKLAAAKVKELQKNNIEILSSVGKDIKLKADKISEKIICDYLKEKSDYYILSEESEEKKDYLDFEKVWIIDPLDGSLNFSRGIPFYCISVALWEKGRPILGAIYDLVKDELYFGKVREGAFCCGNIKLKPSDIEKKEQSIIATGFPVYRDFDTNSLGDFIGKLQQFKKVRLFGSAAMSIILVARGSVEAYTEENIAIWDVAGALAILKAAGGEFLLSEGNKTNIVNVFASNGKLII